MDIKEFWNAVVSQDKQKIRGYFDEDACIRWHNSNEQFNLDDFLKANCLYPNKWRCDVEKIVYTDDIIITITRVYNSDSSHHATSFIKLKNDKIIAVDEYWGEDGEAPDWRKAMNIGAKIK